MKITINFMFLVLLVVCCMSFFSYSWTNYKAVDIIERNAEYENISRETERDFNRWDFERQAKLNLGVGLVIFFIMIAYIVFSIKLSSEKTRKTK